MSGAVGDRPASCSTCLWPEGEDEPIVKQLVQRHDVSGELCRLQAALGLAQLIREGVLGHGGGVRRWAVHFSQDVASAP